MFAELAKSQEVREGEWDERSLGRSKFGASDVWKIAAYAIKQSRKRSEMEERWDPAVKSQPNALLPRLQRLERALTVMGIPAARKSSSSVIYCNNALDGFFSFFKYLFIWLHLALDAASGI